MVLTVADITESEKRRFKKYQEQGMLPSSALRKIESERRAGFQEEEEEFFTEDMMFKLGLGAIGIAMIIVYLRAKMSSPALAKTLKLENIKGIDLHSLNICRQNDLI